MKIEDCKSRRKAPAKPSPYVAVSIKKETQDRLKRFCIKKGIAQLWFADLAITEALDSMGADK